MKHLRVLGLLTLLCYSFTSQAADTMQQYIEQWNEKTTLEYPDAQMVALKRIQWAGTMDSRLYDPIFAGVQSTLAARSSSSSDKKVAVYQIMALGYSGNPKYTDFLQALSKNDEEKRLARYASKALKIQPEFQRWNRKIEQVQLDRPESMPYAEYMYLKMLNTGDDQIQKLAARAIFHETRQNPILLNKAADILLDMAGRRLNSEQQDAASWLAKAIGHNSNGEYRSQLLQVIQTTPYEKLKKYASKYL